MKLGMIIALFALPAVQASSGQQPQLRQRRWTISIYLCGSSYSYYPCGPCVYNCYPSQQQYYPPVIYQPPTIVQPQAPQSTQQCIGPCVNSQCPSGYTCNAYNVCCAIVAGK
ncbi:hypothetical protein ANCCAN_01020 [Ancylostoma caninum]|uniref:CC domain-containing protein n=1 Tax=Ancylostoma caninum TaxID=29170 RepID=A0A368H8U7_ANCCA|nr:hypothetical protein ANCCAN_01020 [Ancylostoma caninum]